MKTNFHFDIVARWKIFLAFLAKPMDSKSLVKFRRKKFICEVCKKQKKPFVRSCGSITFVVCNIIHNFAFLFKTTKKVSYSRNNVLLHNIGSIKVTFRTNIYFTILKWVLLEYFLTLYPIPLFPIVFRLISTTLRMDIYGKKDN